MKILFVCTGNICRSPMAEQMLFQLLEQHNPELEIQVSSAGTMALDGYPMDPKAAIAITKLGFAHLRHKATQLTHQLVAEANLVLTSTVEQRAQVVELLVKANRYTFTLKEFGHLAEFEQSERDQTKNLSLEQQLADTISLRGFATLDEDQDLADPYQRDQTKFDIAAAQTLTALQQVVSWLP